MHLIHMFVGEQDEMVKTMRTELQSLCEKPGYPEIKGYLELDCTHESSDLEDLRQLTKHVLDRCVMVKSMILKYI